MPKEMSAAILTRHVFCLSSLFYSSENFNSLVSTMNAFFHRYPVDGYKPIQDPPISDNNKARDLFQCLDRLLPAVRDFLFEMIVNDLLISCLIVMVFKLVTFLCNKQITKGISKNQLINHMVDQSF